MRLYMLPSNTLLLSSALKMALSKPALEKIDSLGIEHTKYDFNSNWDGSDYVDPLSLADTVSAQDL